MPLRTIPAFRKNHNWDLAHSSVLKTVVKCLIRHHLDDFLEIKDVFVFDLLI